MVSNSFRFSLKAKDDLDEALEYISKTLADNDAAINLLTELERKLKTITDFPESCPVLENKLLKESNIRKVNIRNYVMYYVYDKKNKEVVLLRFIYGKRELDRMIKRG